MKPFQSQREMEISAFYCRHQSRRRFSFFSRTGKQVGPRKRRANIQTVESQEYKTEEPFTEQAAMLPISTTLHENRALKSALSYRREAVFDVAILGIRCRSRCC